MKTTGFYILIAILSIASSCNSEQKDINSEEIPTSDLSAGHTIVAHSEDNFPQNWKLVSMSGMMINSETSGDDMDYQETYSFLPNQTFTKQRINNGELFEASGTFDIIRTETGEEYFRLSYPNQNTLIENCDGGKQEWLFIEDAKTLRGTANACDHPTKTYKIM